MSVETLAPPRAETATIDPELAGRLLEAAFMKGADYHKNRILRAFDGGDKLPELPRGDMADNLEASEKRYRKASDLLYRETPLEVPEYDDGITKELILSLADNLAFKGIENSVITAHADFVSTIAKQLGGNTKLIELRSSQKSLEAVGIEDNQFYRDFFDSGIAAEIGLDSPQVLKRFLKTSFMTESDPLLIARGISLEVSTRRYLEKMLTAGKAGSLVRYGNHQEDAKGGDIVILDNQKIIHVDVKMAPPADVAEDEIELGYRLYADKEKQIYKAVVWAESWEPVADDSFRLTDPKLQHSLQQVLAQIR